MKVLAFTLLLALLVIAPTDASRRRQTGSSYPGNTCCTTSSAETIRSLDSPQASTSRKLAGVTDVDGCSSACDEDPVCEGFSWEENETDCRLQSDFGEVNTDNANVDTHFKSYIAVQHTEYAASTSIDTVVNTTRVSMEALCDGTYTESCIGFVLKGGEDGTFNGSIVTELDAKTKKTFGNESAITTYLREGNFSVMRVVGEYEFYEVSVTKLKLHTKPRDASALCSCAAINNKFNFFCPTHLKDEALVEISCGLPAPTESTGTCTYPKCARTPLYSNYFCEGDEKTWTSGTHNINCSRGDNLTITVWERSSSSDASAQVVLDPMSVATLPSGSELRRMAKIKSSGLLSSLLSSVLDLVSGLAGTQPLCVQDAVSSAESAPAAAVQDGTSAKLSLWRQTGTTGLQKVADITGSAEDQKIVDQLAEERVLNAAIQTASQTQHILGDVFVRLPGVKLSSLVSSTTTEADFAACEDECSDCDAFSAHTDLLAGNSNGCKVLSGFSLGSVLTLSADADYVTYLRLDSGLLSSLVSGVVGSLVGETCGVLSSITSTEAFYEVLLEVDGSGLDTA